MPEGPLKTSAIKKYAPWLLTGAVGTGVLLNQLGEEVAPSAQFKPAKINGAPIEQEDQTSKQVSPSTPSSIDSQESKVSKLLKNLSDEQSKEEPKESDRLAYMEMMQNAQQAANQNQLSAALLKAGMQAGAAIAGPGVKMDTSVADALAASADKPVANVKGLMETDISSKKLQQLQEEMTDEAKMRDPNSEISKVIRDAAVKAGFIKPGTPASAMILDKMGLNLTSIMNVQENARSRADAMKLARENRLFDMQLKRSEKEKDIERQYEEKKKEKVAPLEASRQNLKRNIAEYIELVKKVGTGALYGPEEKRMHTLQTEIATDEAKMADPTSSAMSGEVEKYRKGLPAIGTFVPERESTAISVLEKKLADVDNRALAGYVARGIKPDPTLYAPDSNELTTPNSIRVFKSSYKPGSIVTTTSGSYQIGEDGKTGTKLNE